jgi:hypothetical protein
MSTRCIWAVMTIDTVKAILLLSGINEKLPIFATYCVWVGYWYRRYPQNLLSNCEFWENEHTRSHTLLKGTNEFVCSFHIDCLLCVQSGMRDMHIMLLSNLSYVENRQFSSYGHNWIISCRCHATAWHFESIEHFGKFCVVHDRVCHLQPW